MADNKGFSCGCMGNREGESVHISLHDTTKTVGVMAGTENLIISTSRFMKQCSAGKFAHRAL